MVFIYFVVSIIWLVTWGITTRAVIHNRGYFNEDTKWFWLGFFFTFFAIIVASTKPVYQPPDNSETLKRSREQEERNREQKERDREKEILLNGGWKCVCGRVNRDYISTCACGKNKRDGIVRGQLLR